MLSFLFETNGTERRPTLAIPPTVVCFPVSWRFSMMVEALAGFGRQLGVMLVWGRRQELSFG